MFCNFPQNQKKNQSQVFPSHYSINRLRLCIVISVSSLGIQSVCCILMDFYLLACLRSWDRTLLQSNPMQSQNLPSTSQRHFRNMFSKKKQLQEDSDICWCQPAKQFGPTRCRVTWPKLPSRAERTRRLQPEPRDQQHVVQLIPFNLLSKNTAAGRAASLPGLRWIVTN